MFDGQPKEIIVYQDADGAEPFNKWLSKLRDVRARARIEMRLDRLQVQGNPGDYKEVGGVYELRIDYGPGYRVYLAFAERQIVVLLCGGDKSTQDADIRRALKYWLDYQERTGL
jgi:putative addiction module killer protein